MFREEEEEEEGGEGPEGESIILRVRAPSRAAGQSHATPIQQRHTTIYSTLRAEREMRLGRQPVGVFFRSAALFIYSGLINRETRKEKRRERDLRIVSYRIIPMFSFLLPFSPQKFHLIDDSNASRRVDHQRTNKQQKKSRGEWSSSGGGGGGSGPWLRGRMQQQLASKLLLLLMDAGRWWVRRRRWRK